jgi:polyribonucleotide 5'-hydroxyl-kinase
LLYAANSINPDVYKALMKELAQTLETQFSGNAESRAAGMIINTMGWVEGLGFEVNIFFPNCNMPFG